MVLLLKVKLHLPSELQKSVNAALKNLQVKKLKPPPQTYLKEKLETKTVSSN